MQRLTFFRALRKLILSFCVQNGAKYLLNLGCGTRFHSEWINIDLVSSRPEVMAHDLSRGIPLRDESCDVVYHSHVLEHIRRQDVKLFLAECRRVLRPGGVLRVAVPDLEKICRLYLEKLDRAAAGDAQAAAEYQWMVLEMYDQAVREHWRSPMWEYLYEHPRGSREFVEKRIGGVPIIPSTNEHARSWKRTLLRHLSQWKPFRAYMIGRFRLSGVIHQWMYDRFSLAQVLRVAGFEDPVQQSALTSRVPNWTKYNLDTEPDGTVYKPDSLFMEAFKPVKE
jgi:predicted SAM-dependent methyltransferase